MTQDNRGQGAARNAGIERATGEYIGFCDADDEMESDMYEKLHEMVVIHNADFSACGHCDVYAGG